MSQHESVVLCRHLHLHEDDLLHWSGAIVRLPTATAMLIQGWWGLAAAYATVAAPMVAGLVRGGAPLAKLLLSPVMALPVTTVAAAGVALANPFAQALGISSDGLLHLAFGGALAAGIGYFSGVRLAGGFAVAPSHQRGALVVNPKQVAVSRGCPLAREGALTLAGIELAAQDETKHFKFIGTTGTGKSTAIHEVLSGALERGDRAVIADPDGGYLARFYDPRRGDVILNPFDKRSVKWDLFREITNAYDVEQLARALIPDDGSPDRAWRGYARTFFSAVTRQARAAEVTDVAELYRLLVIATTSELRTLVAGTPAQPFLEEHNGRMFDSIRSVTSSAVGALEYIAAQDGHAKGFSVREWVREGSAGRTDSAAGGVLFIPYEAGQIAALRAPISAWMRLAVFEAMSRGEGDQRLWFIVDELDALGQIDGLKDALARLRKFGGRCILGFQSIAQVSSTYGQGDAHTLVENCGNTLILRCSASEGGGTSRFASRLIGEREVLRTTESRSRRPSEWLASSSQSDHFSTELALLPSEIEQLPDLVGLLKVASRPEWLRVALEHSAHHSSTAGAAQAQAEAKQDWMRWRAARREYSACAAAQEPGQAQARRAPGPGCDAPRGD
jgi:type IV secretory pathway TraG/TraD family ATPase VirD4